MSNLQSFIGLKSMKNTCVAISLNVFIINYKKNCVINPLLEKVILDVPWFHHIGTLYADWNEKVNLFIFVLI